MNRKKAPIPRRAVYYSVTFSDPHGLSNDDRTVIDIKREILLCQLCQSIDSVVKHKRFDTDVIVFVDEDKLSMLHHDKKWNHIKSLAKIIPFKIEERWKPGNMLWSWALATHKWFHFKRLFQDMKYDVALFLDADTIATRNLEYLFYNPIRNNAIMTCEDKWVGGNTNLGQNSGFVNEMVISGNIPFVINSGQFLTSKKLYETHLHKMHKNDYQTLYDCVQEVAEMEKKTVGHIFREGNRWFNEESAATLWLWKANVPIEKFKVSDISIFFEHVDGKTSCPNCGNATTIIHYGSKSLWMIHWRYWDTLKYMLQIEPSQMDEIQNNLHCGCIKGYKRLTEILNESQRQTMGRNFLYTDHEWNPNFDKPYWAWPKDLN